MKDKSFLQKKPCWIKNFRQAINFAFNRHAYTAQLNGEEGADKIIRNSLVPDNYVQVAGKTFGQLAQDELLKYGEQWKDVTLTDGKDTIYNPTKAKSAFEKAKSELQAKGVSFPIHLDVPGRTDRCSCGATNQFAKTINWRNAWNGECDYRCSSNDR